MDIIRAGISILPQFLFKYTKKPLRFSNCGNIIPFLDSDRINCKGQITYFAYVGAGIPLAFHVAGAFGAMETNVRTFMIVLLEHSSSSVCTKSFPFLPIAK